MIKKLINNFFFDEEPIAHRLVSDIIEDQTGKCLIVAVSDSRKSSELNFYDVSADDEFKVIRRITLDEVFAEVKKLVSGIQVPKV